MVTFYVGKSLSPTRDLRLQHEPILYLLTGKEAGALEESSPYINYSETCQGGAATSCTLNMADLGLLPQTAKTPRT